MIHRKIIALSAILVFVVSTSGGCFYVLGKEDHERKQAIKKSFDDAYFYYQAGEYQQALEYYANIVKIDPGFAETYYHIADCYRQLDQIPEAFRAAEKAAELAPDNYDYSTMAGSLAAADENYTKALVYFDKAAALRPGDFDANLYAGIAARELGDLDRAESAFKASASANPLDGVLLFNQALLYEEMEQKDKAEYYWRTLAEKGENVDPSWRELAAERLGE